MIRTQLPHGFVLWLLLSAARVGLCGLLLGLFLLGMSTCPARAFTAGDALGTVTMGTDTTLSAAVYDSSGQLVRHLYIALPQTGDVTLTWDGKDDQGNPLPSGNYQWRAITTSAVGQDSGNIGNAGDPSYGASADPMQAQGMAYDSAGNLYMISTYEEDSCTLRRYNAANISTGLTAWEGLGMGGGTAIATDGTNVYFAIWSPIGNILSYNASTGAPTTGWTPFSASTADIPGLAVDGSDLWVCDQALNEVKLYNKTTGAFITSYAVTNPRGIAADGSGNAWVVSTGVPGSVIQLNFNGAAITATGKSISNLQNPCGVAYFVSGSTPYLYVTESNAGTIDQYNISGTPTLADPWPINYFGVAQPGAILDFKFYWPYDNISFVTGLAAIAATPNGGQFAVTDYGNTRAMVYSSSAAPSVVKRFEGRPLTFPDSDENVGADNVNVGWLQYNVTLSGSDPVYGKPWTACDNWMPTNGVLGTNYNYTAFHRKLSNGIEYLYYLTANPTINSFTVYQLNSNGAGAGMRESVVVSETADSGGGSLTVETDTNGDGIVGDSGDTITQDANGWYECDDAPWVDTNGNLWYPYANLNGVTGIAELPLSGFDSANNPLYNWTNAVIVCQYPLAYQLQSFVTRYDPNFNRVYLLTTVPDRGLTGIFIGGTAIEVDEATTGRRSTIFDPGVPSGLCSTDTITGWTVEPSGNYFYTGHLGYAGQEVYMYTWDGLLVANAIPGTLSGNSAGWLDNPTCDLAAVNYGGSYYCYAEDDCYGRCIRYAFSSTGESFVTRSTGNFSWAAPPPADQLPATNGQVGWEYSVTAPVPNNLPTNDLVAWWKLDENGGDIAADASGNGLDGYVMNTTWNPTGGRLGGALSFNGSDSAVALPNFLLDNSAPNMTFACWIKTNASGVIVGDEDFAGDTSWNDVYTPLLYIGTDGYARASFVAGIKSSSSVPIGMIITSPAVVNDNNWHHLAFVISMYYDTLYVDGVVAGTAYTLQNFNTICPPEGGIYSQLGVGYVGYNATNTWPGCPGPGWFFYNGLLDDARLYYTALSAQQVATLAAGAATPTLTATPTCTPVAGVYSTSQTVTLSCATSGAAIRYTTDGSTPSETAGTVYSTALSITSTTHLKAIAYLSGMFDSPMANGLYTIGTTSSTPGTIQWTNNGVWTAPTTKPATLDVSNLLCNGSPIYPNVDSEGDTSEMVYWGDTYSFTLTVPSGESVVLDNWSVTDWNNGAIVLPTCTVSIDGPPNSAFGSVTFTQGSSGAYETFTMTANPTSVTLTPGAYTISMFFVATDDGYSATGGLNQYTFNLTTNTLNPQTSAPTFAPGSGTTVAISSATGGATINYTTNGTVPSSTVGTVYSSPVSISAATTLMAIAYETGLANSSVTSANYTVLAGALDMANTIQWVNDGLWKGPANWPSTWPAMETVSDLMIDDNAITAYDAEGDTYNNGWYTGHDITFTQTVPAGQSVTITGWSVTDWNMNSVIKPTCTLSINNDEYSLGSGAFPQGNSNGTYTNYTLTVTPTALTLGPGTYTYTLNMQDLNCQNSGYAGVNQFTLNLAYSPTTTVATPTFSPAPLTADCTQLISILTDTPGAAINYTTDGSTPSQSHGTLYSTPVSITGTNQLLSATTLQAIAYETGLTTSGVASGIYTINPGSAVTQIACGGWLVPPFTPDTDYTGGTTSYTTAAITVTGVANAAPMAVYQNFRTGACTYTVPNITPGATCTVRLHFEEPTFNQAGQRQFNVNINGVQVLTNFDIFAAAGAQYKAVVETFPTVVVGANGNVTIIFTYGNYMPLICGIEVLVNTSVVVAPSFTPLPGPSTSPQNVTLSCATSGATIYYTTNGATPSSTVGTVYSTPVNISANCTLQAVAYATGLTTSPVTSGFYGIFPYVPPTSGLALWLRADTGVTTSGSAVSAWNDLSGADYNVSQSNATLQPTLVSNAIDGMPALSFTGCDELENTNTLTNLLPAGSARTVFVVGKANASGVGGTLLTFTHSAVEDILCCWDYSGSFYIYYDGMGDDGLISTSAMTTIESPFIATYRDTGTGSLIQCYLNGVGQTVTNGIVSEETGTAGLTIGNRDDWPTGAPWNGDIAEVLVYNTNLSDIARQQVEAYLRERYTTLPPACAAPTFSPAAGTYSAAQNVTISTTTNGASIRYTTDGSEPTETAGTLYSSPVTISSTNTNTTLQAIAYASGYADSNSLGVYYIQQCVTPTFTPVAGTYYSAQSVTISTTTSGATIYYTTNGTTPSSTNGTVYSSPVAISATNTTLQAIAYESGFETSPVASGVYIFQCATPTFTPVAGAYGSPQSVTISSLTGGATIRYTTNGATPTETAGTVYSSPVYLSSVNTTTLQAIAYESGMTDSTVASGLYSCSCSYTLFGNTAPGGGPQLGNYELGVQFQSSTNGFITGLRVYSPSANGSLNYTATLWSASGTVLGQVAINAPTSGAWAQGNFATPVPITANTTYVASYTVPTGRTGNITPED